MTHTHQSLTDSLKAENRRLDNVLRRKVGICLQTYKVIAALTRMAGVLIGGYAIAYTGMDPATALTLTTAMVLGPDAVEAAITHGEP